MGKFLAGLIVGILLAVAVSAARNNHWIRTKDRWIVERKAEAAFADTYVDTRDWGVTDWLKNPKIVAILAKHGIRRMGGDKSLLDEGRKALDEGAKALDEAAEKMRGAAGK